MTIYRTKQKAVFDRFAVTLTLTSLFFRKYPYHVDQYAQIIPLVLQKIQERETLISKVHLTTELTKSDNLHIHMAVKTTCSLSNTVFKTLMDIIKKVFNAKIYYKMGNHCERYEHFLWMKAHELVGVDEFDFGNIIKARAEGIEMIKDKRVVKAGDLSIIHGHEFGGGIFSPVNVARGLYMRGKVSAMQGHSHVTSENTELDMDGKMITTWSVGCLCELNPQYRPLANKYNHGFAIVDIDGKEYQVRNKRIHNGKVL